MRSLVTRRSLPCVVLHHRQERVHQRLVHFGRGATALETVIILPLILLIILILIWVGVMANARASLTTALSTAARLATTRANIDLVGREMVPPLNSYWAGTVDESAIAEMLSHNPPDPQAPFAYYHDHIAAVFSARTGIATLDDDDLPVTYIYTLYYLSEALKLSLGDGVRFPCDPMEDEGYNCVGCYFLNPFRPECRASDGYPCPLSSQDPNVIPPDSLGIECRFRPGAPVIRPIDALLRIVTLGQYKGNIVIRSRFFPQVQ